MTEMEITVPDEVPVMTLPNCAFFPQALMPLHIFEPRYQAMLRDVLATNRLFAVAGLDRHKAREGEFEPPHRVATLGIVRACQQNADGTANLLLQGVCRLRLLKIVSDAPYRRIRAQALASEPGATDQQNEALRRELSRLLTVRSKLAREGQAGIAAFLKTVHDPEAFADIAAFSVCEDNGMKQKLLETLDVHHRLHLLGGQLRSDIEALKLTRKLQGTLPDEKISGN
jgi:ATP-dependent Lon protease